MISEKIFLIIYIPTARGLQLSGHEELFRMRLAARTLLEWKTPKERADYQRVLADIVIAHPIAQSTGLGRNAALLEADVDGTILWYLSGTINRDANEIPLNDECYPPFLATAFFREFLRLSVIDNEQIWPNGPSRARVADIIVQALADGVRPVRQAGARAFLSCTLPVPLGVTQKCIAVLESASTKDTSVIAAMSTLVQNSRHFLIVATGLLVLSTSIGLFLFLGSSAVKIDLPSFLRFSKSPFVIAVWGLGGIINLVLKKYKTDVSAALLRAYGSLFELLRTRAYRRGEIDVRSATRRLEALAYRELGEMCGRIPGMLLAVLRDNSKPDWMIAALVHTRRATVEVAREALHFLRLPDMDDGRRNLVFQWLCKVRIIVDVGRHHRQPKS